MTRRVVVAGGHGQIALHLERLLAARGDEVIGLIRNPAHVADVEAAGARAVVIDLERCSVDDVTAQVRGADAVVFAAGAGPGSGAARKDTVDRAAAVLLADAAVTAGVSRYVMVSAMGADRRAGQQYDEVFAAYLRAKAAADDYVLGRPELAATVVRPGLLTNAPGTGRVHAALETGRGDVPREDVAAVLTAVLDLPETAGMTFELISGDDDVAVAVARLSP